MRFELPVVDPGVVHHLSRFGRVERGGETVPSIVYGGVDRTWVGGPAIRVLDFAPREIVALVRNGFTLANASELRTIAQREVDRLAEKRARFGRLEGHDAGDERACADLLELLGGRVTDPTGDA